jgi:hypothetical protein
MAEFEQSRLFRPINQSLGQQPTLGPIPANLLAPTSAILVGFYLLVKVILGLGFTSFLLLSLWGVSTWWIVVGEKTWKFTHKFIPVPRWKRGHVLYQNRLHYDE